MEKIHSGESIAVVDINPGYTEFQFATGEHVTTKMALEDTKVVKSAMSEEYIKFETRSGNVIAPLRLFILERRLQECPGGTQKHYLCRYYVREGYKTELFNEIELVAYPNEL